jgi:hypothetical protein
MKKSIDFFLDFIILYHLWLIFKTQAHIRKNPSHNPTKTSNNNHSFTDPRKKRNQKLLPNPIPKKNSPHDTIRPNHPLLMSPHILLNNDKVKPHKHTKPSGSDHSNEPERTPIASQLLMLSYILY